MERQEGEPKQEATKTSRKTTGTVGLRRYSDEDIKRFLEEDKVDEETARKVWALIRRQQ